MSQTRILLQAIESLWSELPALVGDDWPQFEAELKSYREQLETEPERESVIRAQILDLFSKYEEAHQRLVEVMGLEKDIILKMREKLELEEVAEEEPEPRYANAVLVHETWDILNPRAPISPGKVFRLRLDIGELSPESAVREPERLPEHLLPKEDIWLEVMLSSTHFKVGPGYPESELGKSNVAHGRLFLPKDGSAAKTPSGNKYLYFYMQAPDEPMVARARIGYYYSNHLVQSQLLIADIDDVTGGYRFEIDYTLSYSLTGLKEMLPARPQVSIMTNDNGNGKHQVIIRSGDDKGQVLGECTYELDEDTIGELIQGLRKVLRSSDVAPTKKKRSRNQLKSDLRKLAPLGYDLWAKVVGVNQDPFYDVLDKYEDVVIQVSRPTTSSYTFPWGLMYDIPFDSEAEPKICPLVDEWDEVGLMVESGWQQCPEGTHYSNTLCPFGFWGYRYPIEQLSSTKDLVKEIPVPHGSKFEIVAAQTRNVRKPKDLEAHIKSLRQTLQERFPKADVREGKERDTIRDLLGRDLPLVYFYCHGERSKNQTYLGVGKGEKIEAQDFIGWRRVWKKRDHKKVWDKMRPLVFINACHSVEINPDTLVSYLDAFVGAAHAAGVIGTEVKVDQALAMEIAIEFFKRFFQEHRVGQALHEIRLDYLAHGNLFGLVYTPYCATDLKLVPN